MHRSALLLVLALAPGLAQARGPHHRKEAKEQMVCSRDCPDEMHPAAYLEDHKCASNSDGEVNATRCERNHGDEFIACGDSCGWGYIEDRERPSEPTLACGLRKGEKGPTVRCRAFGAESPKEPEAQPRAEARGK